jgi:hypothetical protein
MDVPKRPKLRDLNPGPLHCTRKSVFFPAGDRPGSTWPMSSQGRAGDIQLWTQAYLWGLSAGHGSSPSAAGLGRPLHTG